MTPDLWAIARALGGEVSGGQVLVPGPGHPPKDRSLSVKLYGSTDGFVVHSFAGDDWQQCRDYVRERLGIGSAIKQSNSKHKPKQRVEQPSIDRNGENALRIWSEARDPRGALAERYLRGRCLELPDVAAHEAVRFHANCPFGAERHPALVSLIRLKRFSARRCGLMAPRSRSTAKLSG